MNVSSPILADLGTAALEYAGRGWHVLPIHAGTKGCYPNGRSAHHLPDGYHGASCDPATVRGWWSEWPEANIGLSLAASGLVALDPDLYKPDCEWHKFIKGKDIPDTLVQTSARGGKHYIFNADPTATFPGKLCKGVEIKHNGYIMLEPSVFEGGRYQFETDDDPAPVPDWVQFESATKPPKIETTAPSAPKANGTAIASVKAAL